MSSSSIHLDGSQLTFPINEASETRINESGPNIMPPLSTATMAAMTTSPTSSSQSLGGNRLWQNWPITEAATLARLYGRTTDDFTDCTIISVGPLAIDVYSNQPLTQEQEETLTGLISGLPLNLTKALTSPLFRESGETFSIAVVSPEEFTQVESDPSTIAKYQFNTKILYLPLDILEGDFFAPKEAQHSVTHEFCHALLDTLTTDTLTSRLVSQVFSGYEGALETSAKYLCDPENQDECLVGLGLAGTVPVGIASYLAVKSAPLPSLGVALAGLAAYGIDEYAHFDMHSEGLIAHEYDLLQERVPDENSYLEYTVSAYAGEVLGEFAAETLMAYLQDMQNRFVHGEYYGDPLYGHKTQDLLIERHPALYLAYETLFAPDSPVCGSTVMFTEPFYPLIYEALEDNEGNIYAARAELFEELGAISEILVS